MGVRKGMVWGRRVGRKVGAEEEERKVGVGEQALGRGEEGGGRRGLGKEGRS